MEDEKNKKEQYTLYTSRRLLFLESKYFQLGSLLLILVFFLVIFNLLGFISFSKITSSLKPLSQKELKEQKESGLVQNPTSKPAIRPVESGNPYKEKVKIKGTNLLFSIKSGRVNDLYKKGDGTIIYLIEANGTPVKGSFFAPKDVKPILTTSKSQTEKDVSLNELKKSDFVILSIMEDAKTKERVVSGIRITR